MDKVKGVYFFTEKECLRAHSGAFLHIKNGFLELSRHFDMTLLAPSHIPVNFDNGIIQPLPRKEGGKGMVEIRKNPLVGIIRDLICLWNNHKEFGRFYKALRKLKPDFVYERVAYLNFNAFVCCRLLGIKYVTEINGVYYQGVRKFYYSWFRPLAQMLMLHTYRKADLNFIVGGLKQMMKLHGEKMISVQNGVEASLIDKVGKAPKTFDGTLQICVIAYLSKHHRIENIIQALKYLDKPERFHLHLIGKNFEPYLDQFDTIKTTFHGVIPHHELIHTVKDFHIGIIPGGGPGDSSMKLFTYGAFRMTAIVPLLPNFSEHFTNKEIRYFDQERPLSLAEILNNLIENPEMINFYGGNLQEKVNANHTWTQIFNFTAHKVNEMLGRKGKLPSPQNENLVQTQA